MRIFKLTTAVMLSFASLLAAGSLALAAPAKKPKAVPQPAVPQAAQTLPAPAVVPALTLSQAVLEPQGVLEITNRMTCDNATTSVCAAVCQSDICEWTEPLCRDCFGTGLDVMREVFERLSNSYKIVQPLDDAKLAQWLTSRSMILVSTKSPYDYYGSSDSPGLAAHLNSMCGSTTGFVAVLLDEDQRPTQAVLAICSSSTGLRSSILGRRYDLN